MAKRTGCQATRDKVVRSALALERCIRDAHPHSDQHIGEFGSVWFRCAPDPPMPQQENDEADE